MIPEITKHNLAHPFLVAEKLCLQIGKNLIVNQLTCQLTPRDFVGLIGPNGAGKSSLLRMLAHIQKPSSGTLELASQNANEDKMSIQQRARFLAYLAQHESPVWPLSVKNVVALGRSPWATAIKNHDDDTAAITQALTLTDLLPLADRSVTELSGGEVQRVLLARVFAGKPKVIIADEPIAALDVYHQLHIMELLQAHAEQGGTVIAALHDLSLAARFCNRLILMHHGKKIAEGEPKDVLTTQNLAQVYGIEAYVDCREEGVVIIPTKRITSTQTQSGVN